VWPKPEPALEPDRTSLERAENRCAAAVIKLERIRREEWKKLPKYRCTKLVASYPRRLNAIIAAKGDSTKY
jgi:hypothetical protein